MSKFVDEPTDNLQNVLEKKNKLDLRVFFLFHFAVMIFSWHS